LIWIIIRIIVFIATLINIVVSVVTNIYPNILIFALLLLIAWAWWYVSDSCFT